MTHLLNASASTARLHLARVDAIDVGALDWLTEAERTRHAGMASDDRRRSFLAGHWLARQLGAESHGVEVTRVEVHALGDGRPCLHVDGTRSPLSISLSHSGGWILAGIASSPIGVDIEVPRRPRDIMPLARYAFSPEEAARIAALPDAARVGAFHELWALKEARGKQSGEGFLPGVARRSCTQRTDDARAQAVSWRLGEGGAVAVALDHGAALEVEDASPLFARRYWRYQAASSATD